MRQGKTTDTAFIIYVLYAIGYFFPLTAIIGVAMAYANRNTIDEVVKSHYNYQISLFWWGFLWISLSSILAFIFIGVLTMFLWVVWSIIKIVKGMYAINRYEIIK